MVRFTHHGVSDKSIISVVSPQRYEQLKKIATYDKARRSAANRDKIWAHFNPLHQGGIEPHIVKYVLKPTYVYVEASGKTILVRVENNDTTANLLNKVKEQGITTENCKLLYSGKPLADNTPVLQQQVDKASILKLQ